MIQLDLIEFADLTEPSSIVQELVKQIPGIEPPIPLEAIAEALGIHEIQYKHFDGFEGALVADQYKTEGVILINNSYTGRGGQCRQRYSLGHELGHFILPKHSHEMACSVRDIGGTSKENIEQEADEFSSLILMPEALFGKETSFKEKPSLPAILELAIRYNVSVEACANRYVVRHPKPAMLIYYKDKKMKYFKSNHLFPFYFKEKPGGGVPAPANSLTNSVGHHNTNRFHKTSTDSHIWLSDNATFHLPKQLTEGVLVQENGFSMTLLTFETDIKKKEELMKKTTFATL